MYILSKYFFRATKKPYKSGGIAWLQKCDDVVAAAACAKPKKNAPRRDKIKGILQTENGGITSILNDG